MEAINHRIRHRNLSSKSAQDEVVLNNLKPADSSLILNLLKKREYSHIHNKSKYLDIVPIQKRVNDLYNGVYEAVNSLRIAVDSGTIQLVEVEVSALIGKLFDTLNAPDSIFNITIKKRQERELFVCLGGIRLLLRLFSHPFCKADARKMRIEQVKAKSDFWNEVLVILREVSFTIPSLADNNFSDQTIIFLMTMLSHSSVFDNAINLLEEILAIRTETFQLGLVPNLYSLLDSFSMRQVAHFCRALSLMLFEPEDRQLMDGMHTLRSLELLSLRRDRMMKGSHHVEKNQFLLIEMPGFVQKLLQVINVMNYGPTLTQMISYNISSQTPLTSDILHFLTSNNMPTSSSSSSIESDWKRLHKLHVTASSNRYAHMSRNTAEEEEMTVRLLEAFSATNHQNSGGVDINALYRVMQLAREIGLNDHIISHHISDDDLVNSYDHDGSVTAAMIELDMITRVMNPSRSSSSSSSSSSSLPTPSKAKKALQFHAMLLVPHHVEVLFVLCSLLSGRNKINVQKILYHLNLHDELLIMMQRMSWHDISPHRSSSSSSSSEHAHGPSCECNPENAVRVQFLRLVHNYYDRDFIHNEVKSAVISYDEYTWLKKIQSSSSPSYDEDSMMPKDMNRGLISMIINIFLSQPCDSIYRFWLSSCLEAYLRGNSRSYEQLYVAHSGIINNIISNISNIIIKPSFNLQTAFDLLGEVIKCNHVSIEALEVSLGDDVSFRFMMDVMMNNLIDSNVFVRSLYLTMEMISDMHDDHHHDHHDHQHHHQHHGDDRTSCVVDFSGRLDDVGFLYDSWIPFSPQPISSKAINIFNKPKAPLRSNKPSSSSSSSTSSSKRQPRFTKGFLMNRSSQQQHDTDTISSPTSSQLSSSSSQRPSFTQPSSSSSSSLSSLSDGIKGAFQGIREAACQLLSTGSRPSSSSSSPVPPMAAIPAILVRNEASPATRVVHITHTQPSSSLSSSSSSISQELCIEDRMMTSSSPSTRSMLNDDAVLHMLLDQHHGPPSNIVSDSSHHYYESDDYDFITPPEQPKYTRHAMDYITPSSSSSSLSTNTSSKNTIKTTIQHPTGLHKPQASSHMIVEDTSSSIPIISSSSTSVAISSSHEDDHHDDKYRCIGWQVSDRLFRLSYFFMQERESILLRLVTTITLRTINHENICCLNTALLILLLAHRRGQLPYVLQKVRMLAMEIPDDTTPTRAQPNDMMTHLQVSNEVLSEPFSSSSSSNQHHHRTAKVMTNFRELLWFWQEYYLRRGRDRLSIEFSTHVPFIYWRMLVDMLCADDGSATSLLHHPISLPMSPYIMRQQAQHHGVYHTR